MIDKYKRGAIILVCIVVAITTIFLVAAKKDRDLESHYSIVPCIISSVKIRKGNYLVYYSLEVNNRVHTGTSQLMVQDMNLTKLEYIYVGKQNFVVAFDTLDVDNNRLLLTPKDYRQFKVTPDEYVLKVFELLKPYQIGNGW